MTKMTYGTAVVMCGAGEDVVVVRVELVVLRVVGAGLEDVDIWLDVLLLEVLEDVDAVTSEDRIVVLFENGNAGLVCRLVKTVIVVVVAWLDMLVISPEVTVDTTGILLSLLIDTDETPTDEVVVTPVVDDIDDTIVELFVKMLDGSTDEVVVIELDAVDDTLEEPLLLTAVVDKTLVELLLLGDIVVRTLEVLFAVLSETCVDEELGDEVKAVEEIILDDIAEEEFDTIEVLEGPTVEF